MNRFTKLFVRTVAKAVLLSAMAYAALAQAAGHNDWIELNSVSSLQTVNVHTPHSTYASVFESNLRIRRNGRASGTLEIHGPNGRLMAYDTRSGSGILRSSDGGQTWVVMQLMLSALDERGHTVMITVAPDAHEDCLIYTVAGSGVHAMWEAPGSIRVR